MKYQNITISGRVGAGSTTLLSELKKVLKSYGWKFFSGGEFMRHYAIKHGLISKANAQHHYATVYGDDFDKEVDYGMKERLQKGKKLVLESDLSGFMAQEIPGVLKVLLVCDDALRVDRVANRDNVTIEEAKQHVFDRETENVKKWKRLYGDYDFWDPKYYDLVIDTYSHSKVETLEEVLKALESERHDTLAK